MTLKAPRVGMYKSYVASMDEGWTRWIFEQWGIDYTSLENKDVKAGNLRAEVRRHHPPAAGHASDAQWVRAGTMPDEYVGGLGDEASPR